MNIRKGTESTVLLNSSGNNVREGTGSRTILDIRGKDIRNGTGSTTLYNCTERLGSAEIAAVIYALGEISA